MQMWFWVILAIGIICTAIQTYKSYINNKENPKEATKKAVPITIFGVSATIALSIAGNILSNYIINWGNSKDEHTITPNPSSLEINSNNVDSNNINVIIDGATSGISDYSNQGESDSDKVNIPSFNSFPTSSSSVSVIESTPVIYNHSANIVNGGFCCYDDGQYYFGDSELKKSEFPSFNDQTTIYSGSAYYINPVGDYLYFTTPNKNNSICRVKKDGTNFEVLYSSPCHEVTFYEGWLYFCSNMGGENYHICQMNPENLEVNILYNCREWYMSIYNDRIFFCNYDDNYNIYSMNLDGTDCKPIYYGECYDLCIVNNKIYFSQGAHSRQLYSIDLDGSNSTLLRDLYTIYTNYRDDKLYYVDSEGLLCKCNLDGTESESVLYLSSYSYVVLLPNNIIGSYDRNREKNILILET